jgi:hypothetical protein
LASVAVLLGARFWWLSGRIIAKTSREETVIAA